MFPALTKFSFQHRALSCYLIMIIWIFCLIAGMYKYIVSEETQVLQKKLTNEKIRDKYHELIFENCNPPSEIGAGSEGINDEDTWMLQGIVLLTRHGDRGPLTHVRLGEEIQCNKPKTSDLFKMYQAYLWNASLSGKAPWVQAPGPFHNFPSMPLYDGVSCPLGQLTFAGIDQSLKTGLLLRKKYAEKLGWSESIDSKDMIHKVDVETQSTRYRRTFQTALALLWALLPVQTFPSIASSIKESHSILFCNHDCACPVTDFYSKKISAEEHSRVKGHYVKKIVKKMAKVIFDIVESDDVHVVKDALLAYMCHDSPLPCRELPVQDVPYIMGDGKHMKSLHSGGGFPIKSDFLINRNLLESEIELDIDYNNPMNKFNFDKNMKPKMLLDFDSQMEIEKFQYFQEKHIDEEEDVGDKQTHNVCIQKEHLYPLFDFINWNLSLKSLNSVRKATLNAYGLLVNIVQYFIRFIADGKPKFVLYSGHDKTLNTLILALGAGNIPPQNVKYMSRLIFEVYRKKALVMDYENSERRKEIAQDFYFRVIFNGLDITDQLKFCYGKVVSVVDNSINRGSESKYLCPIEKIVRFVHDDYFSIFNASNYKDACSLNR